jgi:hypothetical protein
VVELQSARGRIPYVRYRLYALYGVRCSALNATLIQWPSDGEIQNASVVAFKEVEQLLAAIGINAKSMLAQYSPPVPAQRSEFLTSPIPNSRPPTLHDLMQLYANMPTKSQLEDQVETCEMAIAAEDLDKTMAMYMI